MNKTTEALELAEALENDAKEHREVSYGLDCPPERTANWKHALNCEAAARLIREALAEPVKQEPVAWWNGKETAWFEHELCGHPAPDGCTIPLYARPVRTKDLTEQQALEKLCNYINQNFKTQKEAAKSFEVTEGFLSMVLNGKKPITEAMAHRLSLTRQTMFLELTSLANGNTAPVRTKDLTDDELFYAIGLNKTIHTMMKATEIGRAAIAADRKLNGVEK